MLFSNTFEIYKKFNYEWADPRTNDFLLISSPFKLLGIVGFYLWFCLQGGPRFMKNREPFKLKYILLIYNFLQVLLSAYFFVKVAPLWIYKYSFKCEPVDYSNNEDAIAVASLCHMYFLSKLLELLDTIFFVLRKKYAQVSGLNLYHHTIMVFNTWLAVKYVAGGHVTIVGLLNSCVHTVMYTYYFIACLGPAYQKYLTWKKYLTIMQLVQFAIGLIHSVQVLPRQCQVPHLLLWIFIVQSSIFIYLFIVFYVEAYKKRNVKER